MASAFTHVFVALAGGKMFSGHKMPRRFWWLAAICAVLPDADAIGFKLGVSYTSFWGHRGFTHSLVFALLLSLLVVLLFFRSYAGDNPRMWWRLVAFFFIITSSHTVLDMMTTGGEGVAIFAPFDNTRYFLPWRVIRVSPIGVAEFFSEWGLRVIKSELLWVWLPLSILVVLTWLFRKSRKEAFLPEQDS